MSLNEDRYLHCDFCDKEIRIPFNQVGGFWHLNQWHNDFGVSFTGGCCSPCLGKLNEIKADEEKDERYNRTGR